MIPVIPPAAFRVEPKGPAKQGSLEFRRYADLIRSELRDIDYTPLPADSREEAELVARLDCGQRRIKARIKESPVQFQGFPGWPRAPSAR